MSASDNPIRLSAQNNAKVASTFTPRLTLTDLQTHPVHVVISCIDPRADPKDFWALAPHAPLGVVRTAGGRVADALRSLRVVDALGVGLKSVAVVHHTECGLGPHGIDDAFIRAKLAEKRKGEGSGDGLEGLETEKFLSWKHLDAEESVKEDMRLLRADTLLGKDLLVLGYVLDDKTGVTREVFL